MSNPATTRASQTSRHYLVYIVSALAALAGLLFGYDTGVISSAILFCDMILTLALVLQKS
jgi:hypothetical protein